MSALAALIDKLVLVVTRDGRTIQGELKGFDQATNVILADSHERIWSSEEPPEDVPLGLYIVRGDNVVVVGEVDSALDSSTDWNSIRADPLIELKY